MTTLTELNSVCVCVGGGGGRAGDRRGQVCFPLYNSVNAVGIMYVTIYGVEKMAILTE